MRWFAVRDPERRRRGEPAAEILTLNAERRKGRELKNRNIPAGGGLGSGAAGFPNALHSELFRLGGLRGGLGANLGFPVWR